MQDSGRLFWNLDACFGLFRKKSAGKERLPSLHGTLYFEEQDDVDAFVSGYKTSGKEKDADVIKVRLLLRHRFGAIGLIMELLR